MDAAIASVPNTVFCETNQSRRGFTLIEVLVSILVITVGLLSLLAAFGVAMEATHTAKEDMLAKQLAQEAMESIVTARETANVTWSQIQNVGPSGGIFVTGLQPVRQAGADGIIGTADDSAAPAETMQDPGPDGIVGTADDGPPIQLTNFRRSILLAQAATPDLRTVTITVQYTTTRNQTRSYILSGMISQYR
jgi:prepilin-type N-terminal cleavage/methylation domain-containing protein